MKLDQELSREFEGLGDRYVLALLRQAAKRHPRDVDVLVPLGDLMTSKGLLEEGLQIDLRLVSLLPADPVVHYNLACSYALLAKKDRAFEALERSIKLG